MKKPFSRKQGAYPELALRNITQKWKKGSVSWAAAARQFAIQFGDRFFSDSAR